jgi:hypothetical protein
MIPRSVGINHSCCIEHLSAPLSHLHTSLAIRKSRYADVTPKIALLTPDVLDRVAKYIEHKKKVPDLPVEDREALVLVNEVSAIGANIPGLSASKLKICNDMRAYFGYFGMPHLFLVSGYTLILCSELGSFLF